MPLVLFNPLIGPYQAGTIQGQSEPGSNGNEGVLRIPQSSIIAGTSPIDCLVSYPGQSLRGGSYLFAVAESAYSTAADDWAIDSPEGWKLVYCFVG